MKDQFTFPEGPANGYNDNFVNVGKAGLEAYNGKSVYVAFRYVGEGPKAKTTTVQLDNVSISSAVLAPTNESLIMHCISLTERLGRLKKIADWL